MRVPELELELEFEFNATAELELELVNSRLALRWRSSLRPPGARRNGRRLMSSTPMMVRLMKPIE